jgi:two-component system, NarL family, nitrate/nitrite response regulator NarL
VTIRILLADDHPLVRSGIRNELARFDMKLEIVGEAVSGEEVLTLAETLRPNRLILDINMPGRRAIDVVQIVKQNQPECRVLILSAYADTATILGILKVGADGYVLKDDDPMVLAEAIQSVMSGRSWYSQAVTEKLAVAAQCQQGDILGKTLTKREGEVLRLIAEGSTNSMIAQVLQTSERTVEFHVSNIFRKLGVKSRLAAVMWAKKYGLYVNIDT